MKTTSRIGSLVAVALAALVCSSVSAFAQVVPGTQSDVSFNLVVSSTTFGEGRAVAGNTVFSGKLVREGFKTKQLLEDLQEAGILPDTTIRGWKLVLVNRAPTSDDGDRRFYLVKAGASPVLLSSDILNLNLNLGATAASFTETVNALEAIVSARTTSFRNLTSIAGSVPEPEAETNADFTLQGVLSGSDKSGPVKIGTETFTFFYQLNATKLSAISGKANDTEDPEGDDLVLEGSISFGPEKAIDIANYPGGLE